MSAEIRDYSFATVDRAIKDLVTCVKVGGLQPDVSYAIALEKAVARWKELNEDDGK
jgi:hypothetical protein